MKKENDIIAAAIVKINRMKQETESNAEQKHYQVIFKGGESLYFDTLSDARNAISKARREADIYHRRNTSAEFEQVETSRPVAEKRWIRYTIIARQQGTPRSYTDNYACVAGYCLSTLGISYTKKETLFISYVFLGDEAEEILYKKGISKKALLDMINKEFSANYSTDLNDFEQDITEEYCNNIGLYQ